jgi:hypothetical protein
VAGPLKGRHTLCSVANRDALARGNDPRNIAYTDSGPPGRLPDMHCFYHRDRINPGVRSSVKGISNLTTGSVAMKGWIVKNRRD